MMLAKSVYIILKVSLFLRYPDDENESDYSIGVGKLISQLELYDQVRVVRDLANATRKVNGGELHSQQGIALEKNGRIYGTAW